MKKFGKVVLLILIVLFCSSCGEDKVKNLSYKELHKKLDNKETFFFVIVKDGCQYCEKYLPKVEEVLDEYGIDGYKVNYTDLSDEENEKIYKEFGVNATPTTIFIKDGTEISILQRIEGNAAKEKLVDKLKKNGYIE